ncbi:MAG TPA: AbgT family transporter, partial [Cellvibrionaceae bacterium]
MQRSSIASNWLMRLERTGNRLPAPAILFLWLLLAVLLVSALVAWLGWQTKLPSGEVYSAKSLLSREGLRWIVTHLVSNFMGFAPVGVVIVTMLGLGVAEHAGLLSYILRRVVSGVKGLLLTWAVVLAGILSNIAFDVGYVLLIPLAGML